MRFINNICNKEKIFNIKKTKNNNGYLKVILYKEGKYKNKTVHRLVAETFIKNNAKLPEINHIDGNKENNAVSNLEWCNKSYNIKHAYITGLWNPPSKGKYGSNNPKAKAIVMIDKKTDKTIKQFNSIIDGTKYIGKNNSGAIVSCCKGKLKTAYGYKWKYINETY